MRVLATLQRVSHVRARKRVIVLKRCLSLVNHNYSNCVVYCNEILLLLIFKPNCPHLHLKKKLPRCIELIRSDPFRTLHHRNITRRAKYVTLFHCQQQHPKKPRRETHCQLSQTTAVTKIQNSQESCLVGLKLSQRVGEATKKKE